MPDSAAQVEEKREHPRVELELSAQLSTKDSSTRAALINVGSGGAFVATSARPAIGSKVILRFRMLVKQVCEASGTVIRNESADDPTGFAFVFDHTNYQMDCFLRSVVRLPPKLRPVYLADVLEPRLTVE